MVKFKYIYSIIFLFSCGNNISDETNNHTTNLKLKGRICNVIQTHAFNGYGIISLEVLSSSKKYYDPRGKIEFYQCIVHDSIAEIYSHAYKSMIGDTMYIDLEKKITSRGRNNNYKDTGTLGLSNSKNYYKFIEANTAFKKRK